MSRYLTMDDVEAAIRGGSVFACGGGGWAEHGRTLGTAAVHAGQPELVSIDEAPDDAIIATAAAIGAPGDQTEWEMLGVDYIRAVKLLEEALGKPIWGLIIGQNGMSSTLNAWLPSALLGVKVVDAVGDVRAHPTGDMGSIGLASRPEATLQSAAGGNRAQNRYIELVARGQTGRISPILRTAADQSGGFIASCRNPVPAAYVKQHAAKGGISLALALGQRIREAEERGGTAVIAAICEETGGTIIGQGPVTGKAIRYTSDAFDVGTITLGSGQDGRRLHLMNEYMRVETLDGGWLAAYPDVITTLDTETGRPVSAGRIRDGQDLSILRVPREKLPLSSSITDPAVYPPVEQALGIELAAYALTGEPPAAVRPAPGSGRG